MTYKILSISDGTAQTWHRGYLPALHCQDILRQEDIALEAVKYTPGYDCYVFHRKHPDMTIPIGLKAQGKKIVWELDDDIWHIPKWNMAYKQYADDPCRWFIENADEVIVSTSHLAGVVVTQGCTVPITVLPNLIDLNMFPVLKQEQNSPLRVVWSGSACHDPDLEIVARLFGRLLDRFPTEIICLFQGAWPECMGSWVKIPGANLAVLQPHSKRVGFIEPVAYQHHGSLLGNLAPDIMCAIIAEEDFALSKSNLKVLESHACGAACVASDLPPYQNVDHVQLGRTEDELYHHFVRLITDSALRKHLGHVGRLNVELHWSWQNCAGSWCNFFRNLAK